jgi:hypothetical protein
MGMRLSGALALVLGVVAFAGPAFAGNGNRNGNGNNGKADGNAAVSASGNSADAPGQLKKDDAASTESPATTTTTTVAASTSSSPASNQGVKPGNDTAHDTHASASSTKTKLYGNGQTAGQIAIRNGASPSTVLHGPGNSQPHKAAPCSGGHEVDVHALKSRRHRGSCGSVPTPGHPGHDGGHNGSDSGSDPGSDPGSSLSTSGTTTVMAPTATKTVSRPKASRSSSPSRASGAALAAIQRPARATLPFTGFPLWIGVAAGIALLGLGLALALFAGRETEREVGP